MDNPHPQTRANGKENLDQDSGITTLLSDFASTTTAHGVGRIAASSDYRFKFSWLAVWFGVMISFTWMVVKLAVLYTSRPVSTGISVSYEEFLTFPGVTICNFNMLLKSKVKSMLEQKNSIFNKNRTTTDVRKNFFASTRQMGTALNMSNIKVDSVNDVIGDVIAEINSKSLDYRTTNSYQFHDFITYCSWAGLRCNHGYFETKYWKRTWNWKYGNCFTFNGYTYDNGTAIEPLVSSGDGGTDLRITIDMKKSEYIPSLTLQEGIRILIEDQDMPLYPFEKALSIAPGMSASISIKKSVVEREDVHGNGSCRAAGSETRKYSVQDCVAKCKGNTQIRLCNCTDVQYSQLVESRACKAMEEKQCIMFVHGNFSRGLIECNSKCPQPCREIFFAKSISQANVYPTGFLKIHSIKNMTTAYVKENIILIEIKYRDQTVQTVATKAYYKFDNLMSDIGGQLGLWIGVSAVTCIEFVALLWNIVAYIMHRRKLNKIKQSNT
ncbi:acid-sensing ion channel 5-like [Rhopilema esculentum]|uniref:acid-sensing ion channel 5-like n=1 Tax=Rhopilema esculentum TaxID=499914 RepID=UPI0031D87270